MGHELVHHLKPTLPEVDGGLIALICISAARQAPTSSVLEAAATPPPTGFIFKLHVYSDKNPPRAPFQWFGAYQLKKM